MPRGTRPPAPARRVFCAVCNIAPGIHEPYVSWRKQAYCVPHARAMVTAGEAEVADFILLVRRNEQDQKARDELFSPALRARIANEKTKEASL